ncbi:MAG: hypothetical protein RIC55_01935 [Pirellulaceae bacterium]
MMRSIGVEQHRPRISLKQSLLATTMIAVGLAVVRSGVDSKGGLAFFSIFGVSVVLLGVGIVSTTMLVVLIYVFEAVAPREGAKGLVMALLFVALLLLLFATTIGTLVYIARMSF